MYNSYIEILINAYKITEILPDKIPVQHTPPKANKNKKKLKKFFFRLKTFVEYSKIIKKEIISKINQIIS